MRSKKTPTVFSPIAKATQVKSDANVGPLLGDWNSDPSWFWPPPFFQAYCKLHFLKECSLHHLKENEDYKHALLTRASKPKKASKWPSEPTRVQPARRAREKNWKDQSGVGNPTSSSPTQQSRSKSAEIENSLENRHEQLQLHLAWPVYKTQIEDKIKQIYDKLRRNIKKERKNGTHHIRSFKYEMNLQCRYCRFNPEVADRTGSTLRKLAPPAPMHLVQPEDLEQEQFGGFGGLRFAVGLFGNQEMIVLLGMDMIKDFVSQSAKGVSKEKKLGSTRETSRKRSRSPSLDKIDERVGRTRTRKRK
ncbi:uncharacterized protein GGS25DRAFT_348350 [Hypoxylon fragiforme]|uniref:uncharacterized protein n=1 Tax=Hypoxylon fragiforme TaxID=63214 RepID=UPI0020C70D4B|nr:uncharacterized protein GGS25DRAFT_348350 [Hypoxylon fragiforme]KAI2607734.1 hypothetical protein GGS25DRAFT_348350 [Hypoxylon fragiforme]